MRLELRGRGDVQVFRVRLPGPEVTKGEPEDARLEVAMSRSVFNQLAEKGQVRDWREAFEHGDIRVSGDAEIQKLIGTVIERHLARAGSGRPTSAATGGGHGSRGDLHHPHGARGRGPRLAVKDILDTAGIRTTYGSAIFADHVPDRSAEAVHRLEAAGYVQVGRRTCHEFAFGLTSENPHYGTVPNPLRAGRIAGGSSGGSAAALAAGLADAALGTDTGGSIRAPAACCGVVGFKPSFGLVPTEGCFPLAPSFDHVGPMARSVDECVRMMAALAPDLDPVPEISFEDVEVGVAWAAEADPLVRSRVEEAAALFPRRRQIPLPAMPPGVADVRMRETAEVHATLFAEHRDLYGTDVAAKIERGLRVTDAEYQAGLGLGSATGIGSPS